MVCKTTSGLKVQRAFRKKKVLKVLLKLDVPLLTSPIEAATANSVIIFFGFDLVSRWASLVTT